MLKVMNSKKTYNLAMHYLSGPNSFIWIRIIHVFLKLSKESVCFALISCMLDIFLIVTIYYVFIISR